MSLEGLSGQRRKELERGSQLHDSFLSSEPALKDQAII
jgi:hypothetical protein